MPDDKATIRDLRLRTKELERLVERQSRRIEQQSRAKYKLPRSPRRASASGVGFRVIVPDTHGCYADEAALAAFLGDLEVLAPKVREIVLLGDHLDCGGFLALHHTIGYVAEAAYSFEDDKNATNILLDKIQELCPKAVIHYLEGNHERRIERWCVTQTLAHQKDAECLRQMFSPESVLHLKKRNIAYYRQGVFYDGLRIPGTIRLGRCHFTHGVRTGRNAARETLSDFGGNVVFGHTHTAASATTSTVKGGGIGSWCPGALCRLQPLWNHTKPTSWNHGYAIQVVRKDGDFMYVHVPIIEGRSYLVGLGALAG